tara:strand:- start:42 stop:1268 length:1227 start_codon:yes stop_codon:yes gene_type:complete
MTGYPEAFQMGGLLKGAATLAAGYFTGGAALGAGMTAGAATGASIAAGAATGGALAAATGEDVGAGMVSGGLGGMGGGGFATAAPAAGASAASAVPAGTSHLGSAGLASMPTATGAAGGVSSMAGTGSVAAPIEAGLAPNMSQVNTFAGPTQGGATGLGYSQPIDNPFTTPTQGDMMGNSLTRNPMTGGTPSATRGGFDAGTPSQDKPGEWSWKGMQDKYGIQAQDAVQTKDFHIDPQSGEKVFGWKGAVEAKPLTDFEMAMKLGKPLATLGLSGLEQSDFMVDPDFNDPRDKYDPRSTLDLSRDTGVSEAMSRDTGLRLLARGGYLGGGNVGDGMSDDIPATIEGDEPAALSQGEFVIPADVVSHLGNGSSEAGSNQLHTMMDRIRKARTGRKSQGKEIKPGNYMPK